MDRNDKNETWYCRLRIEEWKEANISRQFARLDCAFCAFQFQRFFFFFLSAWIVKSHEFTVQNKNHYSRTVTALFTHLKIGPTALFTHLKIILLQCFQFSVFNFSNNKFNPNGPNDILKWFEKIHFYIKICIACITY